MFRGTCNKNYRLQLSRRFLVAAACSHQSVQAARYGSIIAAFHLLSGPCGATPGSRSGRDESSAAGLEPDVENIHSMTSQQLESEGTDWFAPSGLAPVYCLRNAAMKLQISSCFTLF
jgi:hypothetical protein